jgi:hypothetical protein
MSYDRFIPANYHGKQVSEAGSQGYQIIPRTCYCDYKPDGEKKECGAAFKSTSPNAHSCPLHRDAARKQRASAYRKRMREKR